MRKMCRITYNNHKDKITNCFMVHVPDGRKLLFKMHSCGLFYHNMGNKEGIFTLYTKEQQDQMKKNAKSSTQAKALEQQGQGSDDKITTVVDNKKLYTN